MKKKLDEVLALQGFQFTPAQVKEDYEDGSTTRRTPPRLVLTIEHAGKRADGLSHFLGSIGSDRLAVRIESVPGDDGKPLEHWEGVARMGKSSWKPPKGDGEFPTVTLSLVVESEIMQPILGLIRLRTEMADADLFEARVTMSLQQEDLDFPEGKA